MLRSPSPPTERQQQIAAFLLAESRRRGILPTQREIAERFGFASVNSVRSHLRLMEKKGMLNRLPGKARGLKLKSHGAVGIPLVGHIAAGHPEMAIQHTNELVPVPHDLFQGSDLFALKVKGESMRDAGILPGDIAVMNRQNHVSNGEIAAVLLDDDATLKYLFRHKGAVVLRGANPDFPDIFIRADAEHTFQVLGRYVGLIRRQGGWR